MPVSTTKARFSKSEVENLVKKKDQSLSYVKPSSARSLLWNKFQERTPPDKVRKIIFFGDFSHIASVKERIFLHMFLNLI